ncbi:MAG TPA: lysylphosphatidylglycerol synthase domain-containing protein [Vicinamibacteria bacterium]|nr:lysylphosphatidylglycerol synthase domain-containing protein [Vicinamibacteria bacterium]
MIRWTRLWRRVALLAALVLLARIVAQADFSAVPSIAPAALWLILVPYLMCLSFDALGWQRLLAQTGYGVGFGPLLVARLSSEALGQSVPSGTIVSDGLSQHLLTTRSHVSPGAGVSSLLARRVFVGATHGSLLAAGGALALLYTDSSPAVVAMHALALAAGIALVVLSVLLPLALTRGSLGRRVHGFLLAVPYVRLRSWLGVNQHHFLEVDQKLARCFGMPAGELAGTAALFLLARFAEVLETVAILSLLGARVPIVEVICFENLLSLVRALAFFLPGGLGVQDLGYVAVLNGLGVVEATSVGAAFVLVKRIKEIVYIATGYVILALGGRSEKRGSVRTEKHGGEYNVTGRRPKVLFVCGSLNQTTQMHQVARELTDCDHGFTPYYCDGFLEWLRRMRLLEFTILGFKLRARCLDYLERNELPIDFEGRAGGYDLVLTCSDLVVPRNVRGKPVVLVQEGMLDPATLGFRLCKRFSFLPLWLGGTSTTGLSGRYERFCVASDGYRDLFVANGAAEERVVVTGIPNFDDCRRYLRNQFPHRNYVLVCSSDARETFKRDDRRQFIEECLWVARGRRLIFKLHPNEDAGRAAAEIKRWAPEALVYSHGSAEEMIANCDVLITQYSSTVFVGLALGKEVHSYFDLAVLRRLMPVQNGRAARNIANACRDLLAASEPVRATSVEAFAAASMGTGR